MERIEQLELRGVTRRFGAVTAVHAFDLALGGGSFTTLLGPSGCGKTTVLNCLAGLLDLSGGEILLNGRAIQHVPAERRGFGMVFQNYALFPHLTAARNVGYGLAIRHVSRAEQNLRVRRALELVHLEEFAARYPGQLSGGQQQRLAIARTIVLEPSLLLLDEPLSNLDANLRNELRIEIKRIHTQLGLTTVYVTHDQAEALSLSDLVVVMRHGRIEQVGTPQDVFSRPRSLYVAGFMGYANRLPVTKLGREGEYWAVQTMGGTRLLATAVSQEEEPTSAASQPGTYVLSFRPDETLADVLPPVNRLRGQVQLVEYLGKAFEAVVQLEGAPAAQLLVQSSRPLHPGESVEFGIRPERLLFYRDDAVGSGEPMVRQGAASSSLAAQGAR
jgi:putative spermidine/putrescine transport system ATP-binding protein